MYIKKLQLLNFQVIEKFEADFEGNIYFITGDNELGKSTLLKAIGALLTGERDDVLRNGASKGFAKMVVGDDGEEYEVALSFSDANPRGTLTIKQKTTGMESRNVSMLAKIFGYQDYDAVEFSRWSETAEGRRKQIAVIKALLPAETLKRIEEIDGRVAQLKDERTGLNRDIKTFLALCDEAEKELEPGDKERYAEAIDVTDLMERQRTDAALIEKAKTARQMLAQRDKQLAEIPQRIQELKDAAEVARKAEQNKLAAAEKAYNEAKAETARRLLEINKREAERIADIEAERADLENRKKNAEQWLNDYEANNPESNGVAEQIAQAAEHNRKHEKVRQYKEKCEQLTKVREAVGKMESEISQLTKERAELVQTSKLPIEGLSFNEDGLQLNGVPFVTGKVSDSQIMEIATKLIIASNPTVKVFRIARGESLGEKRLQTILDIAKRNGFQGFIEQVKRGQDEMMVEEYTEA